MGGPEERLSRRGAPVEQQPVTRAVGQAQPPDVHRLRVVGADHVPEAQVQPESTQDAKASGQPVDLQVAVHGLLAGAAGLPARGVETVRQVGCRLLQSLGDGREVPLVAGDQRRVRLGGEVLGKVERADGHRIHPLGSIRQQRTTPTSRSSPPVASGYGR